MAAALAAALAAASVLSAVPYWPMHAAGPLGLKRGPSLGFYNKGDVPAVRWSRKVSYSDAASLQTLPVAVVGSLGETYLAAGTALVRIPEDGSTAGSWRVDAGPDGCATLALSDDSSALLGVCGASVVQFATVTGAVVSKVAVPGGLPASGVVLPMLIDSVSGLVVVSYAGGGAAGTTVQTFSLSSGFPVWTYKTASPAGAPPLLSGDALYLYTNDSMVHIVSMRFGTETAVVPTGFAPGGVAAAAGSAVLNMVYSMGPSVLYAMGAAPGAGGVYEVRAFRASDTMLYPLWARSGMHDAGTEPAPPGLSASLFLSPSESSLSLFLPRGGFFRLDAATGATTVQKTLARFRVVGSGGVMDSAGTVYGSMGGEVNAFTQSLVEWAYPPLNCSVVDALPGTLTGMYTAKRGTMVSVAVTAGNVATVSSLKRQAYPRCGTRKDQCSCTASPLGPRTCSWCAATSTCIELGPDGKPLYAACASAALTSARCHAAAAAVGADAVAAAAAAAAEASSLPPTELLGQWRGVQVQNNAGEGEWDMLFTAAVSGVTVVGPDGARAQYNATFGDKSLTYHKPQGAIRCIWEAIPNGPQTKNVVLSCGYVTLLFPPFPFDDLIFVFAPQRP